MNYHIIMPLLSYAKSLGLNLYISVQYTQTVFPKLEQQTQLFLFPRQSGMMDIMICGYSPGFYFF